VHVVDGATACPTRRRCGSIMASHHSAARAWGFPPRI
jgi:ribosomal protein S27AE